MDTFGERLKTLRKTKGMPVEELARKVGCTPSMILKLEANERGKTLAKIPRLASALGCSIDALFPEMETEVQVKTDSAGGYEDDEIPFEQKGGKRMGDKRVRTYPPTREKLGEIMKTAAEVPCPFCGAKALGFTPESLMLIRGKVGRTVQMMCFYCGARGSICAEEWLALENWIELCGIVSDGREVGPEKEDVNR